MDEIPFANSIHCGGERSSGLIWMIRPRSLSFVSRFVRIRSHSAVDALINRITDLGLERSEVRIFRLLLAKHHDDRAIPKDRSLGVIGPRFTGIIAMIEDSTSGCGRK